MVIYVASYIIQPLYGNYDIDYIIIPYEIINFIIVSTLLFYPFY